MYQETLRCTKIMQIYYNKYSVFKIHNNVLYTCKYALEICINV
jgi:hypothetical protein